MARISRRMLLVVAPLAPLLIRALLAQGKGPRRKRQLYIGTYTHDMGPGGQADGIYMAEWDAATGTLSPLRRAVQTTDPSFLAAPPSGTALYAVNEDESFAAKNGGKGGSVTAFQRDPAMGALQQQNIVASGGSDPCHITVDRRGRVVFVANYSSGAVSSFHVTPGGLEGPVARVSFHGNGPNAERQEGPHTHGVTLSPDERFLLVNDLGIDRIMVFHVDLATAALHEAGTPWHAKPGSGPRHTVFHPNGRWVYSVNELLSTVDVLAWDAANGSLGFLSEAPTLASGFHGSSKAAQVVIDRTGKFLYASNRGEETLVAFAIDAKTGALAFLERVNSGGKTPRDFTLDPSERWLVVANQDTQNVVVFARDPRSGRLTPTGRSYALGAPVSVLFV